MPDIDDRANASCDGAARDPRRLRAARSLAIIAAALVGLAACVPIKGAAPPAGASGTGGGPHPPIAVERLPGPVALAPGMTGMTGKPAASVQPAAHPPALSLAPSPAQAHPVAPAPAPVPPAAPPPAPPPAPMALPAAASPAGAPESCPPGSIGMWSQPDVAGTAVYICRRLHPPS